MEDVTNELIETGEIVTPSSGSSHDDVEDEEVILCPQEERADPEPEGTKKGRKRQLSRGLSQMMIPSLRDSDTSGRSVKDPGLG